MSTNRRSFLAHLAAGVTAAAALPARMFGHSIAVAPSMPQPPAGTLTREFWDDLRAQFLIPRAEAFFNTGTLGASPRVVLDAVVQHMTHVDRDIAHWDYKPDHENYFTGYYPELPLRAKIGRLINATAEEIALTQNATFGMNFLANGLDLGPGDEVLIDEGAHPGGRCGWELRGKRYGAHVKYVKIPVPPSNPEQLISLYENATTPHTRVWAFPHLTSGTAILFPVKELCRRARERGIVSVVDGAQTVGHVVVDVQDMGCDAYFSSPHKWLLAPKGTGFLYLRRAVMPRVWATLASAEWDNHKDAAFRLMQYGTGNLSLLIGFEKALDFHLAIGSARVQERSFGLADRLRAGLQRMDRVVINSPTHPELRSATTVWAVNGVSAAELQDRLWDQARIRVRSMGDPLGVRQCCHIYNSENEVDRSLATLRAILRA
ncbi:MAG: aminotransferase class V-fold PLP-dependent enzyme [Gemmatimonadota bacterium]